MFRYNTIEIPPVDNYTMSNQLSANNRWVRLAALIPWDELAQIYRRSFHSHLGAPSVDARIVIGALIIKHKLKLDDRGTIELIQENPYMQYFLGFMEFRFEPVFHPSLFVTIRRRLGAEAFDEMTDELLKKAEQAEKGKQQQRIGPDAPPQAPGDESQQGEQDSEQGGHKGILKLDATVCDQYIKYPTDLDLVARARWESERLIDILCKVLKIKIKPRTYRIKARIQYLLAAKNKKLSKRKRHTAIGQQLRYLNRNLGHLDQLLDHLERIPFVKRDYKIFFVIQHLYAQQYEMWLNRVNRCDHRIVNIYQPHVRPIVRGKAGKNVEFGSKISISLAQGIARLDRLSWEAFNESQILQEQVEAYRATQGYWPEKVAVDHIYGTRENRQWCKQRGIHLQVKPLGRPPTETAAVKSEYIHRNDLEGKFGEGKNGFNLNKIRAKLQQTSESWIAATFFVLNVNELARRADAFVCLLAMALNQFMHCCRRQLRPWADSMGDIQFIRMPIAVLEPANPIWARSSHRRSRIL